MAIKAKKTQGSGVKGTAPQLEDGNYLARVVQVIDLGVQPQRPFKGQDKPPAHEIMVTYELVTEFMKDDDGNDLEDKPRWISETFPIYDLSVDRAKCTKRYLALDAKKEHDGDWSMVVGKPCTVTIVLNPGKGDHAGKTFTNIGNVTPAMKGIPVPELVNDTKVFSLEEPDKDVFDSLPDWLQEKVENNLEFAGSPLDKLLNGDNASAPAAPEPDVEDDDMDEDAPW